MLKQIFLCSILLLMLAGCKKDTNYVSDQSASIQVIDGVITTPIMLKMNGQLNLSSISSNSAPGTVAYASGAFYYASRKKTTIDVMKRSDTSLLTSNSFDFTNGGKYTLLVAGQLPSVETVLIEEKNYPYINQMQIPPVEDSVINVRFINLSPDVQPLDIRLAGATENEVAGLAYKGYSDFKAYPGKVTNVLGSGLGFSRLHFEFLENGNVLTDFTMAVFSPNNRFKNVALVITGKKNPTPGSGEPELEVKRVDYFLQ